jgi:hypothetical protein
VSTSVSLLSLTAKPATTARNEGLSLRRVVGVRMSKGLPLSFLYLWAGNSITGLAAVREVGGGTRNGVLFTNWELGLLNLFSAALALVSGDLICAMLWRSAALHSWHLMVSGVFYLAFFVAAVFAVI